MILRSRLCNQRTNRRQATSRRRPSWTAVPAVIGAMELTKTADRGAAMESRHSLSRRPVQNCLLAYRADHHRLDRQR